MELEMSCHKKDKKAVLSQTWPRNAPYIRVPWKFAGLIDPDYSKRMSIVATNVKNSGLRNAVASQPQPVTAF